MCVYEGIAEIIGVRLYFAGALNPVASFSHAPGPVGSTVFTPLLKSGIPVDVLIPAIDGFLPDSYQKSNVKMKNGDTSRENYEMRRFFDPFCEQGGLFFELLWRVKIFFLLFLGL